MKRTILRYGIYSTLAIVALSAIHFFIWLPNASYESSEVAGYLTMILSMIFVFAGIRHFRDHVNGGYLSFGQGMKIGALIVLIPSIAFGLFDILYTEVINPAWATDYYNYQANKIRANASPADVDGKIRDLDANMKLFGNPFFQFFLMALTVFIIGMIVTIISTLALRRTKRTVPATI